MNLSGRAASLAAVALVGAALASDLQAQCIGGGTGGAIPATGTGDGAWPTTLPSAPLVSTLAVTVPPGATVLNSLKLYGLSHTYVGDVHIVLGDPSGAKHTVVHRPDFTGSGFGCGDDFGGDYVFVDPVAGGPCQPITSLPCGASGIPPGTYLQDVGNWPTGTNGIDDLALESIPIASGSWTLEIYDWAGGDSGALTNWELCFGAPTTPPPPPGGSGYACATGGAGGSFPVGGVDGSWPSTLPTGELVAPLAVSVPAGSTKIVAVRIDDLYHTWCGDAQLVLQAPNGTLYNLFQNVNGVYAGGCPDAFAGDYAFVDVNTGTSPCGGPAATFACGFGTVTPDTYHQEFGTWPDGSSGIHNTPLESIPLASGTWNLICYDWYVGSDDGSLTGWDLCFDAPSGPTTYCAPTAPGTSHGCVPTIAASNNPNVAHSNSCVISVSNVEGQQSGLVFYGVNGTLSLPWCSAGGNSFLCVKAPLWRTNVQSSGGTFGGCDGALSLDWNAYQLANPSAFGNPWSAGDNAHVQGWFRDPPSCKTTFLSEALELTYVP